MRFYLAGNNEPVEVIGEECELPNAAGERFAVHHNVLPHPRDDGAEFAVSHIGTGFRVASGYSIADAIEMAHAKLTRKGQQEFQKALEKAREKLADRKYHNKIPESLDPNLVSADSKPQAT